MAITLQTAMPSDAGDIASLLRASWAATYGSILTPEELSTLAHAWHHPDRLRRQLAAGTERVESLDRRPPMSVRVFCALLLTLGCSGGPPAVVYVPGDEFKETVWISTGAGASPVVHVNAPLTLHARRNAGPWVEIPGIELKAGQCWWGATPPEFEPEVADNVRWLVDPDSTAAVFNVQFRSDHTREVRFSRPGVYQLTAYSNVSCAAPATVDTLTVRVINHQQ